MIKLKIVIPILIVIGIFALINTTSSYNSNNIDNIYVGKFNNSVVMIEITQSNNSIDGNINQFIINEYREEKKYNLPITGYINDSNKIIINTDSKKISGTIEDDFLLINWDSFSDGTIKAVTFSKSNIYQYNKIVEELKAKNLEDIKLLKLNENVEKLTNSLNDQIESLKEKNDILSNTKFSYTAINEALKGVENAYNEYKQGIKNDKDYLYSIIEYEITLVEYEYDQTTFFIDSLKDDIEEIEKLSKSINNDLLIYKELTGNNFNYDKIILDNSKTISKTIKNKYTEYLNNSKSILNKSYEYKK